MKEQRSWQHTKHRTDLQQKTYEKVAEGMRSISPVGVATTFQIVLGALIEAVKKREQSGVLEQHQLNQH